MVDGGLYQLNSFNLVAMVVLSSEKDLIGRIYIVQPFIFVMQSVLVSIRQLPPSVCRTNPFYALAFWLHGLFKCGAEGCSMV